MSHARFTCAVLLALLPACAVGPDHESPQRDPPAEWNAPLAGGVSGTPADLARWWESFGDPTLQQLIEAAVHDNPGLEGAASRVREARFRRAVATGAIAPQVDANGVFSRSAYSDNEVFNFIAGSRDLWSAGFDASWELDLFGGVRRDRQAADAEVGISVEDYRDVLVSLIAEVARNYIEFTSLRERITIARGNERIAADTLALVRSRSDAGLATELDLAQARGSLERTRANLPPLLAATTAAEGRLAVLLGLDPGTLAASVPAIETIHPLPVVPPEIAIGVPADLLRRRPDVRRAERRVAAACARIGVAEADYYPHLTLNGSVGLRSQNASNLFDADSFRYSWGPGFSWNIFAMGRVRANVHAVSEAHRQTLTAYEETVLQALDETRNALAAFAREQERHGHLVLSESAAQKAVDLAGELYERGLTDFQTVLDAERSLFEAREQRALSDRDVTTGLVTLFKTLGGGWEALAPTRSRP